MFFEEEYNQINKDFFLNLEKEYQNKSYSILGSPLFKSRYLILGNNWGGSSDAPSQKTMPLINDILAYPNSSTYLGYINFFTKFFNGDKYKMVHFLNNCVYSNTCFLRTPNESRKYQELRNYGYKYTLSFLERILSIVEPNIVICFGNGNNPTSTHSITKILGYDDFYWKDPIVNVVNLNANANSYIINGNFKELSIEVFSFPHASKYNIWSNCLENKESFKLLKNKITS